MSSDPIPPRPEPYPRDRLLRLLNPRSIAVYGASTRPGSFGELTVANLRDFDGSVYAVNPKYPEIRGRLCVPTMADLPEVPDCVFIVAGRDRVLDMVRDCIAVGAGGIVIYASGYAETGKPGRAEEQDALTRIARESGVPIVGPNCIGLHNLTNGMAGSFSAGLFPEHPDNGARIGVVTQSGALGSSLHQGLKLGVSISHVLASGNSCDVDVADLVAYLAEDPDCQSIACLFEGMADPYRMIRAAERARDNGKPLVIFKIATGQEGARAAVSHTGSLAGSNEAYLAAFDRAGVVAVDTFEELLETASFLGKAKRMTAPGVAVVATSGGAAIICADTGERHGVPLPQPGPEARETLEGIIPEFGSARNPVDVTAQVLSDPQSLIACCEAVLADDNFGALIVPHVFASEASLWRIEVLNRLGAKFNKPVCIVWLSGWLEGPGAVEAEIQPNVSIFRSIERCFTTLAAWQKRAATLDAPATAPQRLAPAGAEQAARAVIAAAPDRVLTERESKTVLAAYGIPVTRETLATSEDAAVAAAADLGFPVAMKVESPDIPHKTESGVIRLNLRTAEEVRDAYRAVVANAEKVRPPARMNGVLVQQMVTSGLEMVVGARNDPQFGPLVLVGLGGVLVELLKDTSLGLAPLAPHEAEAMIARLKAVAALDGFRGSPPVDRARLAEIVTRISELAADLSDVLDELDVNPILCNGADQVAVDALLVTR